MNFESSLTSDERDLLLQELSRFAPDDVLLNAVAETQETRRQIRADIAEFKKKRNSGTPVLLVQKAEEPQEAPQAPPIEFTTPPGEAAARVTANTFKTITDLLRAAPSTCLEVNKALRGNLDNTERVLKLMWKRAQVVYSGDKYYQA